MLSDPGEKQKEDWIKMGSGSEDFGYEGKHGN